MLDPCELHGLLHVRIRGISRIRQWTCRTSTVFSVSESLALVITTREQQRSCRCTGSVLASRSSARLNRTHPVLHHHGHIHTCSENCTCCTSVIGISSARLHELRLRCLDTLRDVRRLFRTALEHLNQSSGSPASHSVFWISWVVGMCFCKITDRYGIPTIFRMASIVGVCLCCATGIHDSVVCTTEVFTIDGA